MKPQHQTTRLAIWRTEQRRAGKSISQGADQYAPSPL
jgi:hypothetical protein